MMQQANNDNHDDDKETQLESGKLNFFQLSGRQFSILNDIFLVIFFEGFSIRYIITIKMIFVFKFKAIFRYTAILLYN